MERSHLAPHLRGGPRRSFRYIADLSGAKLGFRAVRRTDPDGGPYLTELVSYGCVATAASGTGVSLEIRTRWRLDRQSEELIDELILPLDIVVCWFSRNWREAVLR